MIRDKVIPTNTVSEYKEMIADLVSENETFIQLANEQLVKGFRFTADQISVNVSENMVTISYYEEMIQVIETGESERYYMKATLKVA